MNRPKAWRWIQGQVPCVGVAGFTLSFPLVWSHVGFGTIGSLGAWESAVDFIGAKTKGFVLHKRLQCGGENEGEKWEESLIAMALDSCSTEEWSWRGGGGGVSVGDWVTGGLTDMIDGFNNPGCFFSVIQDLLLLRSTSYYDDQLLHQLPHRAGRQSRQSK